MELGEIGRKVKLDALHGTVEGDAPDDEYDEDHVGEESSEVDDLNEGRKAGRNATALTVEGFRKLFFFVSAVRQEFEAR